LESNQLKGNTVEFGANFWDILLYTLWFFLFFACLMILFRVLMDLFGDKSLSGGMKTLWVLFIIIFPFLGLFVYLIARGKGMAERQLAKMGEQQAAQAEYIRQAAGTGASAADQIASAKALLDAGTITQDEFNTLKGKALAS
jgi:hypothetical protein